MSRSCTLPVRSHPFLPFSCWGTVRKPCEASGRCSRSSPLSTETSRPPRESEVLTRLTCRPTPGKEQKWEDPGSCGKKIHNDTQIHWYTSSASNLEASYSCLKSGTKLDANISPFGTQRLPSKRKGFAALEMSRSTKNRSTWFAQRGFWYPQSWVGHNWNNRHYTSKWYLSVCLA